MKRLKTFVALWGETLTIGPDGVSLRLRLFAFLLLFILILMLAILLFLYASGVLSVGLTESRGFLENELAHISAGVETSHGILAVEGVTLSRRLSEQAERELAAQGVEPSALKQNPQVLEEVLRNCIDLMLAALEKNSASAVFLVLDATVNPDLPDAEHSRAGLFIRNMEPNALNRSAPSIHFMRGPIALAWERSMWVLPQWSMEFRVEPGDFFFTTLEQAAQPLDISRLYYWNPAQALAGDYEDALLLCVPLLAADGTALGICGFEMNSMLFKLQNLPNNNEFHRAFSLMAPLAADQLDASRALFASSHSTRASLSGRMSMSEQRSGLSLFVASDETPYVGVYRRLNMYPRNAVHGEQQWALAVMLPESDLTEYMMARSFDTLLLLATLLLLGLAVAIWISHRYLAPILAALDRIKMQSWSDHERTHIREIDDLIEYLSEQDARREEATVPNGTADQAKDDRENEPSQLFEQFVANIHTLSPAERAVFNLYVEGYTAKEIAEILFLSINTIKTHNRRIYQKLNISSRKELMVYVAMMKEKSGGAETGGEDS